MKVSKFYATIPESWIRGDSNKTSYSFHDEGSDYIITIIILTLTFTTYQTSTSSMGDGS